ncbi:MAG: hypothetical protein R3B48_15455 [Kofleriaceae bacterium]
MRMANGKLAIISPSRHTSEVAFAALAKHGDVGAIIANNGFHHLGQAEWRARFPKARCFAPSAAVARIKKKSRTPLEFEPLAELAELTGPELGFREVPDTKCGESWFWINTGDGHAWYTSDVLVNLTTLPAFPLRLLFTLTKSAPGYSVFNLALKFIVKDKAATLRLLMEDLEAHPVTTMVPGHGGLLTGDAIAGDTRALIAAALPKSR